jgi:hypothetical protein
MTLKIRAFRVLKSVAGATPATERMLRSLYHREKVVTGSNYVHAQGRTYTVVSSKADPGRLRTGIYLRGGCDLPTVFGVAEMLRSSVTGTCAVLRDSVHISGSRSDILLQALDGIPSEARQAAQEVRERLQLHSAFFSPRLFEPTFRLKGSRFEGEFPKTVVVMSAAADLTRAAYRHREHGFVVDPGGFWLSNSIETAMANEDDVAWFSKQFKSIGRLTVDEFRESFGRLVSEVRRSTGAHILVFNTLTVNPYDGTHNYQMIRQPDVARRRSFAIALAEMSRELDFDVVDVDRILKLYGVEGQVDFAHFIEEKFEHIAAEVFRVLRGRELI